MYEYKMTLITKKMFEYNYKLRNKMVKLFESIIININKFEIDLLMWILLQMSNKIKTTKRSDLTIYEQKNCRIFSHESFTQPGQRNDNWVVWRRSLCKCFKTISAIA